MKGLTVHAALLVAALAVAFFTWTSGEAPQTDASLVEIWNRDPARLLEVDYRSASRTLTVERRERPSGGTYLWGVESISQPAPPAADSASSAAASAPASVDQYPISELGSTLFERLARLQVLRDLGIPRAADSAAFGVKNAADTVVLHFRDGEQRVLALGADVVGGGDRYVLDLTAGRIYVLQSDLLQPFTVATSLRRQRLHDFAPADVRSVVLRAGGTERVMQRTLTADPRRGEYRAPGAEQPDQAFTSFMSQLDGLWVARFREDVNVDTLNEIVRVDYLGESGDTLGTVELYRTNVANSPVPYFLRTRDTVVAGEAYQPVAERIEQDVKTLFGGGNRPANTPSASQ